MKILVVDDEPMILDLVRKVLEQAGHEVITAPDAASALDLGRTATDFDVLLLDYNLPDQKGIDTLREFRDVHPYIPCILSSGAGIEMNQIPGDLATSIVLLPKPYRAAQLREAVSTAAASGPGTTR